MRRAVFGVLLLFLLLADLSAFSQLLSSIKAVLVFSPVGLEGVWIVVVVILLAVTGGLVWLTVLVAKAALGVPATGGGEPSHDAFGREREHN